MSTPLFKCITRVSRVQPPGQLSATQWLFARRSTLTVYDDVLEVGQERLPIADLSDAELFTTTQGLIPCNALRFRCGETLYQLALRPNFFWSADLPFEVKRGELLTDQTEQSLWVQFLLWIGVYYLLWSD